MATLRFDGTDDYVASSAPGTALQGNLTLAALIRRAAANFQDIIETSQASPVAAINLMLTSGNALRFENSNTAASIAPTGVVNNTTDWFLVAVTRTPAPSTPRFHAKNITTGGAWVHENGGTSQGANPATSASGAIRIGYGIANNRPYSGDIALIAFWATTALTDLQVESLATGLHTAAFHALTPSSLTELITLTPTDLEALVTWTVTGPTLVGANPPGWTFDGLGASPPVNSTPPAVTGTAVTGQTLTCTTGTWTNTPTSYAYQWKRAGANISGATSSTYTLVSADKSTSVKCTVTAANVAGSVAADSNAVTVSVLDALPDPGDVLIRTSTGWITLN